MTILRRRRLLRVVRKAYRASLYGLSASVCAAVLAAAPANAATHSHGHHALPTPLHTTSVADTAMRAGGAKKRKSAGKGTPDVTPGRATPRATREAGKKSTRRGRNQRTEPVEDPVPMYRTERETARHGREIAQRHGAAAHGRSHAFASQPAPLAHPGRRGTAEVAVDHHAAAAEHKPGKASRREETPAPAQMASRGKPALSNSDFLHAAGARDRGLPPASPAAAEVYAEGVAHPDDDERMPRKQGAPIETAEETGPAAVGSNSVVITTKVLPGKAADQASSAVVRASQAMKSAPQETQPAVVQGFGGEVAVPSTPGGARPGGTHRRNHPSTWAPEPSAMVAMPLEEREAITEAAVSPAVLPEIYDRNGRLLMPAPLKGSRDVLVHQNLMAVNDGLERIQDDADMDRLRNARLLVSFPVSASLRVSEDLPYNRRVARPWTVLFATDAGRAFYARFRQPLQVNSAARTVNYQARLQYVNGNAAATSGEAASPHLTGQAIDLGKRGMSAAELAWMRAYLLPLMRAGKIDVEEEFQQACFHISVYRNYASGRRPLHEVAQLQASPANAHPVRATETQEEEVQ